MTLGSVDGQKAEEEALGEEKYVSQDPINEDGQVDVPDEVTLATSDGIKTVDPVVGEGSFASLEAVLNDGGKVHRKSWKKEVYLSLTSLGLTRHRIDAPRRTVKMALTEEDYRADDWEVYPYDSGIPDDE
jgi:hypothetical protein